jgi:hypothetical protein
MASNNVAIVNKITRVRRAERRGDWIGVGESDMVLACFVCTRILNPAEGNQKAKGKRQIAKGRHFLFSDTDEAAFRMNFCLLIFAFCRLI